MLYSLTHTIKDLTHFGDHSGRVSSQAWLVNNRCHQSNKGHPQPYSINPMHVARVWVIISLNSNKVAFLKFSLPSYKGLHQTGARKGIFVSNVDLSHQTNGVNNTIGFVRSWSRWVELMT